MFTSLLLLAAAAAGGQTADPVAPARAGKTQCVVPNQEKKTCLATTAYKVAGDSYESTTRLLLAPTPLITMEIHTRGTINKDGQLCETIKLADFQAGTVYMDGKPADDATASAVKSQLTAAVTPLDGKLTCTTIKPAEGGLLLNEIAVEGTARPDLSQKFVWVSDKDGYKLGN